MTTEEYPMVSSPTPINPIKAGFIGLGVMGYPMAGHLAKAFQNTAGHEVWVYNRTMSRAQQWQQLYKGRIAASPAELAQHCDIIFSCVGNDKDIEEVTLGVQGAFHGMKAGSIFVDHTTTSAVMARKLSAAATAKGVDFLDAPVSGGQSGAENGILSIMAGGDEAAFEKAKTVMSAYGRTISLIGGSGSGQLCKMVNQITFAGIVQSLAEAIHFGRAEGLDMEKVFGVISGGAAASWQMQNRHKTMLEGKYDFGFAVDWMRKDLGMLLAEAEEKGIDLPITKLIDGYYAEIQQMGGGRWDTSSLLTLLKD
jgi:3-hydroxyisobutyrate dehydrogenase-like beta-hydroxyacid dehydrogenase